MARSSSRPRRLTVGDTTFLWSVRHRHDGEPGRWTDCREVLCVRRLDTRGGLRIVFRGGPGRLVPDGYAPSGAVGTADGPWLNLHEPGTVRAFLDEATARGWDPAAPAPQQVDGWPLFSAAAARRRSTAPGAASGAPPHRSP
ncbi:MULTISPECIES: hypothetical protein [Streptomycetaceae]|uniref:hypothetical protein n=1 Tax=Streptomycetaceae TaxID=2062 RepID=UPI0030088940